MAASGEKPGEIPAPPAQEGDVDYDALYARRFKTPATYIRSSQTVEECTGCQYDMSAEDDVFLKAYNEKRTTDSTLSEDDFEILMEVYEETADLQAPFASVDNTVIPFETMKAALKQQVQATLHIFAEEIYDYWRKRRQETGNHPLQPTLKFETHQENDDGDPYVCFRRREVRIQRKTRARDMQSTDKLGRLRRELEEGRQLVHLALTRETTKLHLLSVDEAIFKARASTKEQKRRLGIKGDDEDLINQKVRINHYPGFELSTNLQQPPKRQRLDYSQLQRQAGSHLRLPTRPDGRPLEADLPLYDELIAQKENLLKADIEEKTKQHAKWNQNHEDLTREPLSPVLGHGREASFRPATAQFQLLTPPSSVTSESFDEASLAVEKHDDVAFRYVTPPRDEEETSQPAYRRRVGRNGRLWIDRRGMSATSKPEETSSDRWKYDDDDDDEQPLYEFDQYDARALRFRSTIPLSLRYSQQRPSDASKNGVVSPTSVRPMSFPQAQPAAQQPT